MMDNINLTLGETLTAISILVVVLGLIFRNQLSSVGDKISSWISKMFTDFLPQKINHWISKQIYSRVGEPYANYPDFKKVIALIIASALLYKSIKLFSVQLEAEVLNYLILVTLGLLILICTLWTLTTGLKSIGDIIFSSRVNVIRRIMYIKLASSKSHALTLTGLKKYESLSLNRIFIKNKNDFEDWISAFDKVSKNDRETIIINNELHWERITKEEALAAKNVLYEEHKGDVRLTEGNSKILSNLIKSTRPSNDNIKEK